MGQVYLLSLNVCLYGVHATMLPCVSGATHQLANNSNCLLRSFKATILVQPPESHLSHLMTVHLPHVNSGSCGPQANGVLSCVMSYPRRETSMRAGCGFDVAGGASAEANNQAVAALTGVEPHDLLFAEWRSSVMRPCHYVAVDRANQCIVLSIR